jgi:hypothetical protein
LEYLLDQAIDVLGIDGLKNLPVLIENLGNKGMIVHVYEVTIGVALVQSFKRLVTRFLFPGHAKPQSARQRSRLHASGTDKVRVKDKTDLSPPHEPVSSRPALLLQAARVRKVTPA